MAASQVSTSRRIGLGLSGLFLAVFGLLLIDTIIDIWPSVGVQSEICKRAELMPPGEREPFLEEVRKQHKVNCRFKDRPITRVNLGGTHTFLSPDQGLFGLVGIFAALGALVRSLRAVVWAGTGWSRDSHPIAWILLRPIVGAALAIAAYVILRALFLPSGTLAAANPYGFIAMAVLVGLFIDELVGWTVERGKVFAGR